VDLRIIMETIKNQIYMDFETKKLVAPVFNHFYEKYDVSSHEERI
jgi:hypothetical protein